MNDSLKATMTILAGYRDDAQYLMRHSASRPKRQANVRKAVTQLDRALVAINKAIRHLDDQQQ
jgi:hypothetical protein